MVKSIKNFAPLMLFGLDGLRSVHMMQLLEPIITQIQRN